jgi:hypothetical protein
MLQRIVNGVRLIRHALRTFLRYPQLVIPLLGSWSVYAPLVLYLEYYFPWDQLEFVEGILVCFCAILVLSFTLSLACFVVLEMVQHIESGRRVSVWLAFVDALRYDLPKALPIVFIWAILWLILAVIFAIVSGGKRRRRGEQSLTLKGAARTLSGSDDGFSLSGSYIRELNRGLRMFVFLIFPAIAWENLGPRKAMKRGLRALSTHPVEFSSGFVLSGFAALIVFLPPIVLLWATDTFSLVLSGAVWATVLIYCAFAWSFSIFVEQMFAGELYLWHLKWERAGKPGLKNKKRINKLECVERPSILDEVPEFM